MSDIIINRPFTTWCEAGRNCKKYGTDECCDPCPRQRDYFWLLDNSNLPEPYKFPQKFIDALSDSDFDKYVGFNEYIRSETEDFVNSGLNMIITCPDSRSCSLMAAKFVRYYMHEIAYGNNFKNMCWYVDLPKYFSKVQKKIFGDSFLKDEELIEFRKMVESCPLVMWDKFEFLSMCTKNMLTEDIIGIFSDRVVQGFSNIISSRITLGELTKLFPEFLSILNTENSVQVSFTSRLLFEDKQKENSLKSLKQYSFVDDGNEGLYGRQ